MINDISSIWSRMEDSLRGRSCDDGLARLKFCSDCKHLTDEGCLLGKPFGCKTAFAAWQTRLIRGTCPRFPVELQGGKQPVTIQQHPAVELPPDFAAGVYLATRRADPAGGPNGVLAVCGSGRELRAYWIGFDAADAKKHAPNPWQPCKLSEITLLEDRL